MVVPPGTDVIFNAIQFGPVGGCFTYNPGNGQVSFLSSGIFELTFGLYPLPNTAGIPTIVTVLQNGVPVPAGEVYVQPTTVGSIEYVGASLIFSASVGDGISIQNIGPAALFLLGDAAGIAQLGYFTLKQVG